MTAPLTDDDLGAALRAVLQDLSPLATDPLPPPRFAPTAVLEPSVPSPAAVDVVELGDISTGRRSRPRRRRRLVGVGVLAAAAAVVVGAVVGAGVPGGRTGPAAVATVSPPVVATYPDRGGADLGVTPYPVPWRCTAPAGQSIIAIFDDVQYSPTIWTVADGVTCAPLPSDVGRFGFDADGLQVTLRGEEPVAAGGANFCGYIATQKPGVPLAFRSWNADDYVQFYGPSCRLVLPAR